MTSKEDIFKALIATMDYCKENDILKEFLEIHEREVKDVMMGLFTQEQATNMILKERYDEGRLEGERKGIEIVARSLRDTGTPIDVIVKCTGLTKEDIDKL